MKNDKNWMLMTYYCPIHGDEGRVEPLEITRGEFSNKFIIKSKLRKEI